LAEHGVGRRLFGKTTNFPYNNTKRICIKRWPPADTVLT
jgi:hypothetical protein